MMDERQQDGGHSLDSSNILSTEEVIQGEIQELARRASVQPSSIANDIAAFSPEKGSHLDPSSPNFNYRAWTKAFIRLIHSNPDGSKQMRQSGVTFKNLSVHGFNNNMQYQATTGNVPLAAASSAIRLLARTNNDQAPINILRNLNGIVENGEMLLVLGPPGSGCSTFLRALSGQTNGLHISPETNINFRGIGPNHMHHWFRRDVLYNAEVDTHLPHLSVGETLDFAAQAALPISTNITPTGFSRAQICRISRDVIMSVFGISHTVDVRVGDDYVRGVSGGERKRVSIAEAALTGAKFQCWDNSTRGLDSGNAIRFCENLRVQADLMNVSAAVAVYQAPQVAYELFNKTIVLYQGRQIFFGPVSEAKAYFEELGFECPARQTTPDFLTSMTSPSERRIRPGFENVAPCTADEFAQRWESSRQYATLMQQIQDYETSHPSKERLEEYVDSRRTEKSRSHRLKSPYTLPYWRQIQLCMWRGWRRQLADPQFTIAEFGYNFIMSLVLGSMFYNLDNDSNSFYYRGGLIFFALLFNAFASQLEVLTLYEQRPVVEKHNRYAFYHQSAEAISSYLLGLPFKTVNMFIFNTVLYLMANLRREPGPFFFFCLTSYMSVLVMSAIYRTIASVTRSSHQAMIPSSILTIGVMIYSGFTIPTLYMRSWSRWMGYINPLAYAFESLMANEFHGRQFPCGNMVPTGPGYESISPEERTCTTISALPGSTTVDGDAYIGQAFEYYNSHKWRNILILVGFLAFFLFTYIITAEFARPPRTKGEILVFRRGKNKTSIEATLTSSDEEMSSNANPSVSASKTKSQVRNSPIPNLPNDHHHQHRPPIFHWEDICYEVHIKKETRRILNQVSGWVTPGTTTALMGASGAGKTTLLDALATRLSVGSMSGHTFVDGLPTDKSFPHRIGYVQQQDLHMETMTVREALLFSTFLRQRDDDNGGATDEKVAYVQRVIEMLDMELFVDAVIGVPGEGLNVEQRKRLTIGVELASRPELLVFLDEPTSGLDSQTAWAICDLIEKLSNDGQAVLCTIHQPSAMLFERFDRLLLLQPGGKTVYFGELGPQATTVIRYFERHGAPPCPRDGNPAEWMLSVTQPVADGPDWHSIWIQSTEFAGMKEELEKLRKLPAELQLNLTDQQEQPHKHGEFLASYGTQCREVLLRVSKHFWRSPSYMYSKISLLVIASLYVGFSFKVENTIQGVQNQLYAFFMYLPLFINLNEQIMPTFVPQRALYEARERPSRMYHWTTYLLANIFVEMFWNTIMAVIIFLCWYYPVGFVANTSPSDIAERGILVLLLLWMFLLWGSTFSHLVIAAIEMPELAGVPAGLVWMLSMAFCGVGVARADLPAFWSFMYRLSPATYLVRGVLAATIHGAEVVCDPREVLMVKASEGLTCEEFLGSYMALAGGKLVEDGGGGSGALCGYCQLDSTDQFLAIFDIYYLDRWWSFGILWAYVLFNIMGALALYWIFRVPRSSKRMATTSQSSITEIKAEKTK